MPGNQAMPATRILSKDDKHQLAAIIANILQSHLNAQHARDGVVAEPVSESNNCARPNVHSTSFNHHQPSSTHQGRT